MKKYLGSLKNYMLVAPLLAQKQPLKGVTVTSSETITVNPAGSQLNTLAQDLTIPGLISAAITFMFIIAAVIFFFILVIGGIRWIISGGDKANTEGARSQITAGLIGLVIVFSAWAIVTLIGTFFGVALFESGGINIPTPY